MVDSNAPQVACAEGVRLRAGQRHVVQVVKPVGQVLAEPRVIFRRRGVATRPSFQAHLRGGEPATWRACTSHSTEYIGSITQN